MTRREMKKSIAKMEKDLRITFNKANALFNEVVDDITGDTEAEVREVLKAKYGYKFFIGGYAYKNANDLGRQDKGLKINKIGKTFNAKVLVRDL